MILYILYRIGLFLTLTLPIRVSYASACVLADIFYYGFPRDRRAVINNLTTVIGPSADDRTIARMAKDVFRNFAKYLVDFFRSQKIDKDYLKRNVKIEGSGNIDDALAMGKGVIALSAHIGNWELGAFVTAMIGYPINAVVLTHKNKRINDFFTRQRLMGNMKPIEMGASLKSCYRALGNNELVALLGDRDFTKNGISVDFFGKKTIMPKGPATFSYRLGSPIVPIFLVREPDNTFRYFVEKPIMCAPGLDEETTVKELTTRCSSVIEACVKKYPAQWFVFRNIWNIDDKESLRPDTII